MLETVGSRLKKARKYAGLTQVELAKKSGSKQGAISDLESGRNESSTKLVEMAQAMGVSADWLATGKGEMIPSIEKPKPSIDLPASSPSVVDLIANIKDMETNGELSPQVIAAINGVIEAVRSASQIAEGEAKKTQPIDFKALQTEAVTNHGKD